MYIALGVVCLLVIGILMDRIGRVSIRSNDTSVSRIGIYVVSPLQAGAHTVIRWDTPNTVAGQQVQIAVRSKQGVLTIGESPFFAGTASVEIPCTTPKGSASIEIISAQDQSVIAWQSIVISSAGPDCAR